MKKYLCYIVFMLCFAFSGKSFGVFPVPPMPPSPTFAPAEDGAEGGNMIQETFKSYSEQVKAYKAELMKWVKSLGNMIGLNLGESAIKKEKGESTIATAREIKESKNWDIRNEESVSEAFQTLFLTYPNDIINSVGVQNREGVKKQYRDKAIEFSNDNMVELYLSVRELEEKRLEPLLKEINDMYECYIEGKENMESVCASASDTEEELGPLVNGYKIRKIYDSYVRLYEELMAMRAQYETGRALREGVEPFNADQSIEESLEEAGNSPKTASSGGSSSMQTESDEPQKDTSPAQTESGAKEGTKPSSGVGTQGSNPAVSDLDRQMEARRQEMIKDLKKKLEEATEGRDQLRMRLFQTGDPSLESAIQLQERTMAEYQRQLDGISKSDRSWYLMYDNEYKALLSKKAEILDDGNIFAEYNQ